MGMLFLMVIVVYLSIAIFVVVRAKGRTRRILWAVFFALLPTFDAIAAQIYMYYRCNQDGGMRVYETISLRDSGMVIAKTVSAHPGKNRKYYRDPHWDMYRELSCVKEDYEKSGVEICMQLPQRYEVVDERRETRFGVERAYRSYVDRATGKLLGELVEYGHKNTWFIQMFFGGQGWSGWGCPSREEVDISVFKNSVFKIVNSK